MHFSIKYAALVLWLISSLAQASVVLSGTRIIFPSDEKEVTIKLTNEGEKPGLVQVWLDAGEKDLTPEKVKVPFILTPPMFRLDPQKGQTLRVLMMQKSTLPQDRESVFWLNVLEVPPKHMPKNEPTEQEGNNYMQMAFKTRIKVFYRPSQLHDSVKVNQAFQQLLWHLVKPAGNTPYVTVKNDSPFHITISRIHMTGSHHEANSKEGVMIAPFNEMTMPMDSTEKLTGNEDIQFAVLNDYGGELTFTSKLTS